MYLIETIKGGVDRVKNAAMCPPPFGPGFQEEEVKKAVEMRVYGSSFNDPGGDFCEYRLYDVNGVFYARRRRSGY